MPTRRRTSEDADAIIIGAGAAGLSAAAELSSHDLHVTVLEARERLGGRIFSVRDSLTPIPIELGAEFIHGRSPAVMRWLASANRPAIDAPQTRWSVKNGRLQSGDKLFEQMRAALDRIGKPRKDLPFEDFLAKHSRALSAPVRDFARMLVQGYDAADASRVSTLEVLEEWSGNAAADAATFRAEGGYDTLVQSLQAALAPQRVQVRLGTIVRHIVWNQGRVEIDALQHGESVRLRARQAIVTLPLGVLQLPDSAPHSVRFDPPLNQKRRALSALASGPVIKMSLRFQDPFWEDLDDGRYKNAAFFHAPGAAFPTFWTSLPARTATLVAWAAGPNAEQLGGRRMKTCSHMRSTRCERCLVAA
jgi:monoamine oxidase